MSGGTEEDGATNGEAAKGGEIKWDHLLRAIHNGQVLPVVGPGLVTVESEGEPVPYYDWLVPEFACRLGVPQENADTLNGVACSHLIGGGSREDIYVELCELVDQSAGIPVPRGLRALAKVLDFDLFISSTFDGFLARALAAARPGWKPEPSGRGAYKPGQRADSSRAKARLLEGDLPKELPATFLYHIAGSVDALSFAVWEEDYVEFLCGLLTEPRDNLRNLLRELKNRSLLLIGAPFDDWIVRFFLRVAKQERLSDRRGRADYLADVPHRIGEPQVFYFDKVMGTKIINASPDGFAEELQQRWSEKYQDFSVDAVLAGLPEEPVPGSVFISYSRDDMDAAATLAAGLANAGIPYWLDLQRIGGGTDWELKPLRAIKRESVLFLSLISRATEADPDRFVHKERQWAAERHIPGEVFYIPVVIDEAVDDPQREPEAFARLHRLSLPGGAVTPAFIARIQGYLDQYHREGKVLDD